MSHGVVTDAPTTGTRSDAKQTIKDIIEHRPGLTTVVVSLLACLIGSVNLTSVSMWIDEAYTITVATRSLSDIWRMIQNVDVVHALYNVALHPVFAVFGVSEITVRLPSLIAIGVATAGLMVLVRRLAGPPAALAAGLIFSVLPRVTFMGLEGRSYAATAAVAVWLTILFVSLLNKPTWAKYVGYAALAAFGSSLNIFLVLLLGAHGCTLLLERRLRFSRIFWTWLGAAAVGLAGGLPVLLTATSQSAQIGANRLDLVSFLQNVLVNQWFLGGTPTIYLSGGGPLLDGPGSTLWKPAAVLLAGLCWLVVIWALVRRPGGGLATVPSYRTLLGCWLVVPTVILVGYALVASPIYNPRYLSFCAPAVAALIGIGLIKLRELPGRWSWAPAVVVSLIVLLVLPIYGSQRTVYAKAGADWKPIAEFVADHPGVDRAVYFAPRLPPTSDVVVLTSRTAQTLYPAAFTGVRDVTLLSSAAADADIWGGRSRTLAASTARLAGVKTVFVINRVDYPEELQAADEAILLDAGFRPGDRWVGPLNMVVEYTR